MSCSFQPDLTLDEWADTLLNPLDGARYPLGGSIDLTERCNLGCLHCYINQPAADPLARSREFGTTQWLDVIDQLADAGTLFLLFTGGEPLLRKDFPQIFTHARQRGLLVSLFSNGTMLTPEIADLLAKWSLHALEISLYGASEATYEKVTGQPGSFERCLRGIELALEHGLKLDLKTVLLTVNRHELDQMQALTASYGLKFRYDSTLWPRTDGDMSPMQFELPLEETLALDLGDPKRLDDWQTTDQQYKGQMIRAEKVFTCGAGFRSFHIDSSGRLTACMMVRRPAFPVLATGFNRAWEMLGEMRAWNREKNTACETCQVAALCTQCPGWSLAVHGDYETPVEKICTLGHLRATQITSLEM